MGVVAIIVSLPASAQFYSNGASPSNVRWKSLKGENVEVIVPDFAVAEGRRVAFMMDSVSNHICYGLGEGLRPLPAPVVMHAQNAASNGIAIMAPARVEMCAIPATSSYATPWLRQLSVHEYRHAAQYAALFSGHAKWPYYVLGEQALLALTGTLPFWWLEGDAVDAETQASLFGRALQPSFTMHYRAVGREILERENPDVWFSGSYNRHIPSHYELGYQMVTTANTVAGKYAWGEVVDYAAHRFYTITPFEWGMREELGYSTSELFFKTFTRLNEHWDSLPERDDTSERIALSNPDESPYETYKYPLWVDDNHIIALKSSFDEPSAMVEVDLAWGHERTLFHTGYVNTRPALIGDYLYWTEICQLSSFAQEMGSVMYRAPKDGSSRPERLHDVGDYVLYPTNHNGTLAWVRYNLDGTYSVICPLDDANRPESEMTLPEGVECHGMASNGEKLYLLTTGEDGMGILSVTPPTWQSLVVKPSSRVTLSDLVATKNSLYFGSIASGYDEVHSIDLTTGIEERVTTSRYGSFEGSPSPDGERLALTSYDAEGYHLALTDNTPQESIENTTLPLNIVNPEVFRWEAFPCIDTIHYGAYEAIEMRDNVPAEDYSKAAAATNIHSWAPIYYRPEQLATGNLSDIRWGVTATSASILSDAVASVGLYYLPGGALGTTLNVQYVGWVPKFEFRATVDNRSAPYYVPKGVMFQGGDYYESYDHTEKDIAAPRTRASYSLYGRASLPIILSHSYWTSTLTPAVEIAHSNNQLYSPTTESYSSGQTIVGATLQWNSYTRSSYRNLLPKWGFALIGGVGKSLAPFQTTTTVGLLARGYTPAFGANDGFTLKASYMGIEGSGPLNYSVDLEWLTPRGLRTDIYPDDKFGFSLQYDTPLVYPDKGLKGIFSLKRIRLSLFAEGLYGRLWVSDGSRHWRGVTTFGGDLWFDTSWLRLPEQGDLTFRLGCYIDPNVPDKPTFAGGFNVNF